MAVVYSKEHAGGGNKVAGTTFSFTSTSHTSGSLLVCGMVFDNTGTSTPTVSSIAKGVSETASWSQLAIANASSATSGNAVRVALWAILTTTAWADGAYNVTLSASITAKACTVYEFTGATATLRSTVGTGSSTTAAPSVATTGTAPVSGDLVIAVGGFEGTGTITQDTDTLDGSWSTGTDYGTGGGAAATNCHMVMQYKIVTGTSHQTYNPTDSSGIDSAAAVACIQQSAATAAPPPYMKSGARMRTHIVR